MFKLIAITLFLLWPFQTTLAQSIANKGNPISPFAGGKMRSQWSFRASQTNTKYGGKQKCSVSGYPFLKYWLCIPIGVWV
jgi:hypothetical protein